MWYLWEGHDTGLGPYNKWCLRRWAAGVVACFTDVDSGEPCFLFGKEKRQDGGYNVFWGFGDMDEFMPYETAARECAEETLGFMGTREDLVAFLKDAVSLDGQGLLFTVYLGTCHADQVLAEYDKRRLFWRQAMLSLEHFAVWGREPGGDVMDQLVVVRAQDISKAVARRKQLCISLPQTKDSHFAQPCYNKRIGLHPRPPVDYLLEILAKPVTDAARHLVEFCWSGNPLPGIPFPPRFSSPIPGLQPNGHPDGRSVASVVAFLGSWTGGHGIAVPPSPVQLAADLLASPALLAIVSDTMHVHAYVEEWISHALDSPAKGSQACAHFSALAAGLDEMAAAQLTSALVLQLGKEMIDIGQKVVSGGLSAGDGDMCLAAAYRWLCALHFAECLASALPDEASKQRVLTAVHTAASNQMSISQRVEGAHALLRSRLRPSWLPVAAFTKLIEFHPNLNKFNSPTEA